MVNCNNCISCIMWSHDNSLFKCITFSRLFNLHQILKRHNCSLFIESEKVLTET